MKRTFLVLSILIAFNAYCQNELIVSENKSTQIFYKNLDNKLKSLNLEDLSKSKENSIRIWAQNKVLTFGETASLTLYTSKEESVLSETYTFKKNYNLDSLQNKISVSELLEAKDIRRKIDEFPLTIEIRTSNEYHLVSTYGNAVLEKFITTIYRKHGLNKFRDRFINELPRGNYRMGMSMISVDRLLEDSEEKSEFYKELILAAGNELKINEKTLVTEFPLVLINEKPENIKAINALDITDVENYKILTDTATTTAIYGNKGENGVILISTK